MGNLAIKFTRLDKFFGTVERICFGQNLFLNMRPNVMRPKIITNVDSQKNRHIILIIVPKFAKYAVLKK